MRCNKRRVAVFAPSGGPGSRSVRFSGLCGRSAARALRKALDLQGLVAVVILGDVYTTCPGTYQAGVLEALARQYRAIISMCRGDRLAMPIPRTTQIQVQTPDLEMSMPWGRKAPAWTGR